MIKNYIKFLVIPALYWGGGGIAINISNCYSMEAMNQEIYDFLDQLDIEHCKNRDNNLIENVKQLTQAVSEKVTNIPSLKNIFNDLLNIINNSVYAFNVAENQANSRIPIEKIHEQLRQLYLPDAYRLSNAEYHSDTTYKQLVNFFESQTNSRMKHCLGWINKEFHNINKNNINNNDNKYVIRHIKLTATGLVFDLERYFNTFYKVLNEIDPLKKLKEYCTKNINNNSVITLIDSLKNGIDAIKKIKIKYCFVQIQEAFSNCLGVWNSLMCDAPYKRDRIGNVILNNKDMLDSNIAPSCTDLLIGVSNSLSKYIKKDKLDSQKPEEDDNNRPEYIDLLYKFSQYYNSIIANLSKEEIDGIINDIGCIGENSENKDIIKLNPDDINNIKYSTDYINQNTSGIFKINTNDDNITLKQLLQYFANNITLKVINTIHEILHAIRDNMPNNEQELTNIIKENLFKCIQEINYIAHYIVVFLRTDKQFNEAFGNTNIAETITNSIANGIDKLDSLIE